MPIYPDWNLPPSSTPHTPLSSTLRFASILYPPSLFLSFLVPFILITSFFTCGGNPDLFSLFEISRFIVPHLIL